jgi:DnaJ-class molecular chaperone
MRSGAGDGDIYLKVTVLPHASFRRDGDNLRTVVPIDLYTAILGGEVRVPTLERPLVLTIPPSTPNGKVFRLSKQGMPRLKSPDERGDLHVEVEVMLPTNLSGEERELFEKLRSLSH